MLSHQLQIFLTLAAMFGICLFVVSMLPSGFELVRGITISAPPEKTFPHVNELKKWQAWSPWEGIDPGLKRTYEGPDAGAGAIYRWAGNNKVGEGAMTITESRASELVRIRLEFLKPFKATNAVEFTFKPGGQQTVVAWTMTGKKNLVMKVIGLFRTMDEMVGPQFDKGLQQLKAVVETAK